MTLRITEHDMTSDRTQHTATTNGVGGSGWYVSWYPHLGPFTKDQAVTALILAEAIIHDGIDYPSHPSWPMVASWCTELNIDPLTAVDMLKSVEPKGAL